MADRLESYEITVPAGTTKTVPQVTPLVFDPGYLRHWQVIVPDGVAGLAGFAFTYAGQQLVPNTVGAWLTGNGEVLGDDVAYHFTGAQWRFLAYNLGLFPHTFRVRMYVDEIATPAVAAPAVPTVLPVTITAGTLDLSASDVTPLDTSPLPVLDLSGDLTPLELPADTVSADTSTDVTPLDLPADAPPAIADTSTADLTGDTPA